MWNLKLKNGKSSIAQEHKVHAQKLWNKSHKRNILQQLGAKNKDLEDSTERQNNDGNNWEWHER